MDPRGFDHFFKKNTVITFLQYRLHIIVLNSRACRVWVTWSMKARRARGTWSTRHVKHETCKAWQHVLNVTHEAQEYVEHVVKLIVYLVLWETAILFRALSLDEHEKINIWPKFSDVFFQHSNNWNENVQDSEWKTALKSAEETKKIVRHSEISR